MAIKSKANLLSLLKEAGYSTGRIRKEHIMGEQMVQKLRQGELPSWSVMNTLCKLLRCQPGDLVEYLPDDEQKEIAPDESPSEAEE